MARKWRGHAIIVLLLASQATTAWSATGPFDPSRDAAGDIAAAEKQAQAEHKNVLLDIGGNWCSWCILLDRFLRENPDLSRQLTGNYVVVHVNVSKENRNEVVLAKYPKVPGYPFFIVLSPKGRMLHAQDTDALQNSEHLQDGYSHDRVQQFLKVCSPRS